MYAGTLRAREARSVSKRSYSSAPELTPIDLPTRCALVDLIRFVPNDDTHRVLGMPSAEDAARMPTGIKKPVPRGL